MLPASHNAFNLVLVTYDPFSTLRVFWVFPSRFYSIPKKVIIRRRRQIIWTFQVIVGRPKLLYTLYGGYVFYGVFVRMWRRRCLLFFFRWLIALLLLGGWVAFVRLASLSSAHEWKGICGMKGGSFLQYNVMIVMSMAMTMEYQRRWYQQQRCGSDVHERRNRNGKQYWNRTEHNRRSQDDIGSVSAIML